MAAHKGGAAGRDERRAWAAASRDPALRRLVEDESNRALETAGALSTALGILGTCGPLALVLFQGQRQLVGAVVCASLASAYSFGIFLLARGGRIRGPSTYPLFGLFVSIPTLFFLVTHFTLPAGAATFITGPFSYLYFHLIIMTGFLFDTRLTLLAGLLASGGYLFCAVLGQDALAQVTTEDPYLRTDITALPMYAIKAFMMAFGGVVVAALGVVARRSLGRALIEERQKASISRLFGQYVSPEVRERILAEKASTVGERKRLVVLFSDIRGFSSFSEGRDPEAIVRQLNEYFEAMVEAVTDAGGVIDKLIGDAVMATFGGVLELEDPAGAAVEAALEMRRRLAALNEGWARRGLPTFDNGVGVHLGEVLQGSIGSARRKEFTVIGDAVNTAARLEGLTKEQGVPIVISKAVFGALPTPLRARCRDLGATTVKGKREPVSIYGLEG